MQGFFLAQSVRQKYDKFRINPHFFVSLYLFYLYHLIKNKYESKWFYLSDCRPVGVCLYE
jgi:hypothetical protein